MGLLTALNTAISGLNVNQKNLEVLSNNISNANTADYSREVVNQKASFIDGLGQGATIESVTRKVNDFLTSELRNQASANSSNSTITDYYSQVQSLLGQPGASNSIDSSVSAFFVSLHTLANSPGAAAQTNVVNSANTAAQQISTLASSLQDLRLQAEKDIGSSVTSINADLQSLIKINLALQQATATNQSTAGLLDKRDAAINDLAQYVDIRPFYQPDGSTIINTTNGATLLTGTTSSSLNFSTSGSTRTFVDGGKLSAINVTTLDANGNTLGQVVSLATNASSSEVTTTLTGGKLFGLLKVRDSIIPDVLGQLDQLASQLRDNVNAVHNQGTSYPAPNAYTGTRLISGADTSGYSGSIRIAALGGNGSPISSPYADEPNGLAPITLDLAALNSGKGSSINSVDGIIGAINKSYGVPQNKAETGNINNVQLAVVSGSVPDTGSQVKLDFNLNNISKNDADFYLGNVTILDSSGQLVANSTNGSITTTQPSFALAATSTYTTTLGSNVVTVDAISTANLKEGDIVYLNPPAAAVNGIPAASLGGYFTISNLSGNSFEINVSGASTAVNATAPADVSGVVGYSKYATVNSGATTRTQNNGFITASLAANANSAYYTVQASVATVGTDGKLQTSIITYTLANNSTNSQNNLVGAKSVVGNATLVVPQTSQPILKAILVDKNGNELPKVAGLYGNQQGYLKISAVNGSASVAIDQLDSKQLGSPDINGALTGATNQGFSQYFGLNDFFNSNPYTKSGDNITNSALGLAVQNRLLSNPSLVSTGKLAIANQPADTSLPPNFTYAILSGDNSVVQHLAALATAQVNFATTRGLSGSQTTFAQYSGQIIATTSTNSSTASSAQKNSQALLDGYTSASQQVSGVNLDKELANTIVYQNSYSASARVVTVVSKMFDTLIGSIQ